MQKENILLIVSVVLSILVLSIAIFIAFRKESPSQQSENLEQENIFEEENITEEDVDIEEEIEQPQKFIHSAWIPAFDFDNGFVSLEKNISTISIVNPVFYAANSDGTLLNRKPKEDTLNKFITFCKTNEILIIPTIGSFDYKIMESILQSETNYQKHIKSILTEVDKYDFDGIDLDYEKIRTKEKDKYLQFITDLGKELENRGKIFSITVDAKTKDESTDTLGVQDWNVIGEVANQVRIMTYDYTLQTSSTPGPIAPKDWIIDTIEYAKEKIPEEKTFLGIHLYAYLWKNGQASALTHNSVLNILKNSKIESIYKQDIAEGYSEYTCSDGTKCILYHQTVQGVKDRIEIAKKHNLAGVVYWRLGNEGNLLQLND